jgi:hypothetical protein
VQREHYTCTYVHVYKYKHYLKNNLKYKHSGAIGTQMGVVSTYVLEYHGSMVRVQYHGTRVPWYVYHNGTVCTYLVPFVWYQNGAKWYVSVSSYNSSRYATPKREETNGSYQWYRPPTNHPAS